jgi:hypothetical protein
MASTANFGTPGNSKLPSHQAAYGIKLYLVLGEGSSEKRYPVVSANLEFALNQIPVANVILPAGKKISNDSEQDASQLDITNRVKARLVMDGVGIPHPTKLTSNPQPTGGVSNLVIFEGYVGGTHYQFNTNSVSSTITIFHWMQDLDMSTVASGNFMKTSPSDWFTGGFGQSSTTLNQGFVYPLKATANSENLTAGDILIKDWWEEIFKPGFEYKARQPLNRFVNAGSNRQPNQYLINVLPRLKSEGRLKLNSKFTNAVSPISLIELGKKFTNIVMEAAGGSSAFEKLVSLSREFKFVLAPRIFDCLIKEYNPAAAVVKTLTGDEFDFAGSSPNPTVIPAAVLIYGRSASTASTKLVDSQFAPLDNGFIGQFPNPIASTGVATGPFLMIPTPDWMYSLTAPGSTFDITQGLSILPDSHNNSNNSNTQQQTSNNLRIFGDAYAQASYYEYLFAAKNQHIVCGFRTDIELGDVIMLEFKEKSKVFKKRGIVNSINYIFAAGDSPRVNTVIELKHVFDEKEIEYFGLSTPVSHAFFVGK